MSGIEVVPEEGPELFDGLRVLRPTGMLGTLRDAQGRWIVMWDDGGYSSYYDSVEMKLHFTQHCFRTNGWFWKVAATPSEPIAPQPICETDQQTTVRLRAFSEDQAKQIETLERCLGQHQNNIHEATITIGRLTRELERAKRK